MPLDSVPSSLELSSYEDIKENFVIFYASRNESGEMWCPVRWFPRLWLASRALPRRPLGQREGGEVQRIVQYSIVLSPAVLYQIFIRDTYSPSHSFAKTLPFSLSHIMLTGTPLALPRPPATRIAVM